MDDPWKPSMYTLSTVRVDASRVLTTKKMSTVNWLLHRKQQRKIKPEFQIDCDKFVQRLLRDKVGRKFQSITLHGKQRVAHQHSSARINMFYSWNALGERDFNLKYTWSVFHVQSYSLSSDIVSMRYPHTVTDYRDQDPIRAFKQFDALLATTDMDEQRHGYVVQQRRKHRPPIEEFPAWGLSISLSYNSKVLGVLFAFRFESGTIHSPSENWGQQLSFPITHIPDRVCDPDEIVNVFLVPDRVGTAWNM